MVKYRAASLDAVFAALSDPIRRRIVEQLARGEASVGDLAAPFQVTAPAISRHLRVLERAGLLDRHKKGRVHRCRLRPRPMNDAVEWIEQCRQFWEQQFDALERYLAETEPKENQAWPHPAPAPAAPPRRRSSSSARSKRRAKGSSKPGPTRSN